MGLVLRISILLAAIGALGACKAEGIVCRASVEHEGKTASGEAWSPAEGRLAMQIRAVQDACSNVCDQLHPELAYDDPTITACRDGCYESNQIDELDQADHEHLQTDCEQLCAEYEPHASIRDRCMQDCRRDGADFGGRCEPQTRRRLAWP